MYPVIFEFGFIKIYGYGLVVALAFLVSAFALSRQAAVLGLKKDFFWDLSFWILFGGIIGGRLFYIILNLKFFLNNPKEIFMLWHGGLVWYGGFLAGIISAIAYLKANKAAVFKALDLIIPFAALGQSIGRIGCFLNGCCYGKRVWWGLYFPVHNDYLIPAQLFSSLDLLVIFIILRLLQDRPHRQGFILVVYLLLSSLERFLMEYLRNDSPRSFFGLTIFQLISIAIFFGTIFLWCIILLSQKKTRASG